MQTNIMQLQRLHETNHVLQKEHAHLLERNQVLIEFLNCSLIAFADAAPWVLLPTGSSLFCE